MFYCCRLPSSFVVLQKSFNCISLCDSVSHEDNTLFHWGFLLDSPLTMLWHLWPASRQFSHLIWSYFCVNAPSAGWVKCFKLCGIWRKQYFVWILWRKEINGQWKQRQCICIFHHLLSSMRVYAGLSLNELLYVFFKTDWASWQRTIGCLRLLDLTHYSLGGSIHWWIKFFMEFADSLGLKRFTDKLLWLLFLSVSTNMLENTWNSAERQLSVFPFAHRSRCISKTGMKKNLI